MAGLLDSLTLNGQQFMDNAGNVYPQSGGILDPIANTPALSSATKFDWGSGNSIWPMLTALGAGLAGGTGYNSKQRLASGLSQGLDAATQVGQQARQDALRLEQVKNEEADRKAQLGIALANLRLSQQSQAETLAEKQAASAAPASLIASTGSQINDAWDILTNKDTSAVDWAKGAFGGGKVASALNTVDTAISGLASLTGQKPDDLRAALLPSYWNSDAEKAAKRERFTALMGNLQSSLAASRPAASQAIGSGTPSAAPTQASATATPSLGGNVPSKLSGKRLQFNAAMNLYRDKDTGDLYNINGDSVSGGQ